MAPKSSVCSFLIMITLTSVFYHRTRLSENSTKETQLKLEIGSITPLSDNKTFIITPYYDDRETRRIRVIAIVYHEDVTDLYCSFYCSTSRDSGPVKADVDFHSDRFGFPYGTADILCTEPPSCNPNLVSFYRSSQRQNGQLPVFEIKRHESQSISSNFTVCISTMFGNYNNVLLFIQSMEMYKLLGAQRVTIYKNSCSEQMETILKYYVSEGIVEVVEWPIDSYLQVSTKWHHSMDAKDIGYYGQLTTLNDCVYRNMYSSKFVLLNDIDEIILPVKYPDWTSMMDALETNYPDASVFQFENHVFPRTVFDPLFNVTSWRSLPGDNILQHVYREPIQKNAFNNRKMIINPRKVVQTSVHSVLKAYAKTVQITSDISLLYHCRDASQPSLSPRSLINDTTIWKYSTNLVNNVDKVIHSLSVETGEYDHMFSFLSFKCYFSIGLLTGGICYLAVLKSKRLSVVTYNRI